jgi:hypothetical protein
MKSLEIVNKWGTQLEGIKKCIEEDINKGVSWFNYEKLYKYLEDAETIKADLEVLEIIKKYVYYIDHTIKLKSINKSVYNFDYEKLKQWLEKNENE